MHGIIHDCFRLLITRKFGDDIFEDIVMLARCDDLKDFKIFEIYDDQMTICLFSKASKLLKLELPQLFELFGEFFYHYTIERGYSEMLATLGRDLVSFLNGLDAHHYFLEAHIYGGIKSPSFRCEVMEDGSYRLHYYSTREGLYYIAVGLVRECAKHICNTRVKITSTSLKKETFGGSLHTHVTLRIDEVDKKGVIINKSSLQTPASKLLNGTVESTNNHGGSLLHNKDFSSLLPYHVLFDRKMTIRGMGTYMAGLFKASKTGSRMKDCFKLVHPKMDFEWSLILNFVNLQYVIEVRTESKSGQEEECGLQFKGQMFQLSDQQHMLYVGSLRATNLQILQKHSLFLSDMPSYDASRDLILLSQLRTAELGLSKKLEDATTELQVVSRELEKEKTKTEALLSEILPRSVAEALIEGRTVPASSHNMITILFSDIVTFTVISSQCRPDQVIEMLNNLFTAFDELSQWNDVYKVETIGDAYMVCAGVPDAVIDHTERVADMALGMVLVARQVMSPVDGSPLQIRAGIHTGSAMSGVVGKRMPRYCLFGDTVNTASRMESHGVPGKIQISSTTYTAIDRSLYEIEARGVVKIKGKGDMKTYFLQRNTAKSVEQLIGKPMHMISIDLIVPRMSLNEMRETPLSDWGLG